ncbi:thiamine pyrophosphate-binding protein [Opitutales bacterium ASA1]|uniref:alpha-keto acid decarboxylase family protein n=1 Tax=Congregicoccus parvus TaxID=3081749 RepID=UPI002B309055|nr:thiamine pyrophosphate-binding protein [Opitutales bacterium ASA1]
MTPALSIGEYLIRRLHALGVRHVFGIPGDYVLGFYDMLERSPLEVVNTCDEQGAGFAADAYARVHGLGALCVTYCVGGLKVANAVAGAYAEKSPVVVISGSPGIGERARDPLLHHKVRDFDTQKKVFEQLTVASAVLDDARTAFREIDRVLSAALRFKRPVYLELPRDLVGACGPADHAPAEERGESDPRTLRTAVNEAVTRINAARRPVILADVELHRFHLQEHVVRFARRTQIPVAATLLGKSVVGEQHPFYLGVYEGAMGRDEVRRHVEGSDCLVMLGAFMTDINLGVFTARLDPARSIYATSERLSVGLHRYDDVRFEDFVPALVRARVRKRTLPRIQRVDARPSKRPGSPGAALTVAEVFAQLNAFLDGGTVVVADVGDALFGAADLFIHQRTEFLGPAYYTSMGFAIPAALGVGKAKPDARALVVVGDGAFQMTGMELATLVRNRLDPVVVVLNNSGFGTERPMQDGPYNDVARVDYHRFPELLGADRGWKADTAGAFAEALREARERRGELVLIEAVLDPHDRSPALTRLTKRLAERIR